jgi:hypothetical protein
VIVLRMVSLAVDSYRGALTFRSSYGAE